MTRRQLVAAGAVVVGVALVAIWRPWSQDEPQSEEQRLLQLVHDVARAVEQRELDHVRERLAPTYRDKRGHDRAAVIQLLNFQLLRGGRIQVYVLRKELLALDESARPKTAKLEVVAALTRGPRVKRLSDLVPHSVRAQRFELSLAKDELWRVTGASWRPVRDIRSLLPGAGP